MKLTNSDNLSGYRKTSPEYTSDDEYNPYTLKYPLNRKYM